MILEICHISTGILSVSCKLEECRLSFLCVPFMELVMLTLPALPIASQKKEPGNWVRYTILSLFLFLSQTFNCILSPSKRKNHFFGSLCSMPIKQIMILTLNIRKLARDL
jgi:hypothetical protein